jgi:hypothetical protein
MTIKANTQNDDRAKTSTEPHKQGCRCWQGAKRSLMACQTCRNWNRVLTRIGDEYVTN